MQDETIYVVTCVFIFTNNTTCDILHYRNRIDESCFQKTIHCRHLFRVEDERALSKSDNAHFMRCGEWGEAVDRLLPNPLWTTPGSTPLSAPTHISAPVKKPRGPQVAEFPDLSNVLSRMLQKKKDVKAARFLMRPFATFHALSKRRPVSFARENTSR